jgi:hypothetical protein
MCLYGERCSLSTPEALVVFIGIARVMIAWFMCITCCRKRNRKIYLTKSKPPIIKKGL